MIKKDLEEVLEKGVDDIMKKEKNQEDLGIEDEVIEKEKVKM